jgi:hypothetical protein
VVAATPEQERGQGEDAFESGQVFQDAEGRQTTDPSTAMENADSEAERNEESLKRGEVGPGIPPE